MLVSKLQYLNYEAGEFSDIESRSIAQTMDLLNNYPWEQQRNHVAIGLTGPSVTIEGNLGKFLKIGLYYDGKFMLYLLNKRQQLSSKVADTLETVKQMVHDFYNDSSLEQDFVKYRQWVYKPSRHFATREFGYRVDIRRVFLLLGFPVGFAFLFLLPLLYLDKIPLKGSIIITLLFLVLLGGVKFFLLFKYYRFSRDLYLNLSRGIDVFEFGTVGAIKQYRKQDIEWIKEYANQRSRSPWNDCYVYVIQMKDGSTLKFTNLLISSWVFGSKFPGHEVQGVNKFIPTVRNCH